MELRSLRISPTAVASRFGGSGWVVDTVPLALYCAQFVVEQPLEAVIPQAIEVGGDTDTIASITGQVAGTAAGIVSDYERHFSTITEGDEAIRIAQRFADFVCELEEKTVRSGA